MKAMVLERRASIDGSPLALREVDPPEPGPGEVRVRVGVCAVCRTDLHVVEGDLPEPPGGSSPLIPGHQVVGVVDRRGEEATRLRIGQRVGIAWLRFTDGACRFCRQGRENLCPASRYTGYHENGGYAGYAVVRADFAYELPEELDDREAAPLLCAGIIGYRALKRAGVPPGGRLLLAGFGSSAHLVIQLAVHRGLQVYVVTRRESHQRLSREMGAVWAGEDPSGLPEKMDSAILFAPSGRLVPPILKALDRGGILSLGGIHLTGVPGLNYQRHLFYEKEIRSVAANTREDGREWLRAAVEAEIRPRVVEYPLAEANRALQDLKYSRIDGTGVLVIDA